ncbi:MAG: hypothetical protein QM683_00975 [Lacrimispora sp.]
MNNKHIISIFGVVILAVIIGFFLLSIPKARLYYWAFSALLFSLLISLCSILFIYNNKPGRAGIFYTASLSTATFIYLAAVIISLFFVNNFHDKVNSFIFLQLVINALFLIMGIMLNAFSKHLHQKAITRSENFKNGEYNKPSRGDF